MTTDRQMAEVARPTDSVRDPELLRARLRDWLAARTDDPTVDDVHPPSGNGMSSETILLDASWRGDDGRHTHPLVVRVAPDDTAMPVFASYDMRAQFETMRAVGATTPVPIPATYWFEPDPAALGAPFFVMERVDGLVPPDVMPYNFGSWVTEATGDQRATMQTTAVQVLADVHRAPTDAFAFVGDPGAGALGRHVVGQRRYYEWVTAHGLRSPLIERCLDRLTATLPDDTTSPVLSWGDARIGNMIFRDYRPVAVLDWEMAGFGPRELDLGWLIYLHRFFEDIAANAGLTGLPGFLRRDDVVASYREASGHEPVDMDWFTCYAALRHAIVMFRVQSRAIHFGQADPPADPDDMILHRSSLAAMLDGHYWRE